jgi:hypothetical protein
MDWIPIGYFPKKVQPPNWPKNTVVREICSVSECVSSGPEDWILKWRHNEMGFYPDEETAMSVIPPGDVSSYTLFAYKTTPFFFDNGKRKPFVLPELPVAPIPPGYTRLGYDVVSKHPGIANFDHSPLSCNNVAVDSPINRFCLLTDADTAEAWALKFSKPECRCEPGPYHVVEVWAKNIPSLDK